MDTSTQLDSVPESFLPDFPMNEVKIINNLNLCSATKYPIIILGQFDLYIRLDAIYTAETINVVETLSVNILVQTKFIDILNKTIYPAER